MGPRLSALSRAVVRGEPPDLVNSLLTAIVRADGDALVMHVGEPPYVVSASGPIQLSSRPITVDAVAGMLTQLLPADSRRVLDELGAVEYDLPPSAFADGERFTAVVARGGDEIWIEIRRHRVWPKDEPGPVSVPPAVEESAAPEPEPEPVEPAAPQPVEPAAPEPVLIAAPEPEPRQPVIVPLARSPIRTEVQPHAFQPPAPAGADRLLRLAAARGGTALHLGSGARPCVRVDGQIVALEAEPALAAHVVESLLIDLAPESARDALRRGDSAEWILDVTEVGRFRCHGFRDDRGPGGTFRLIVTRPASADHLGLPKDIQALVGESQGFVLVAGPRSSGKSTLAAALVDLVNRTRADHVITIESQITCVHESRGCFVSQREVRGSGDDVVAAVRAAIRENPDVLVIEDMRSPAVVELALEATERGHLVIATISAPTATAAIGRMLTWFAVDRRERIQVMLADGLRAAVSQVLVRKTGGGRVAAREVLLNTPEMASLIAAGRLTQLSPALESGRPQGMVPLNDALAGFVQSGVVDVKDAYRQAFDRPAFLAVLRREGVDTSFADRLA
jgi:twitching motility protein PilT